MPCTSIFRILILFQIIHKNQDRLNKINILLLRTVIGTQTEEDTILNRHKLHPEVSPQKRADHNQASLVIKVV